MRRAEREGELEPEVVRRGRVAELVGVGPAALGEDIGQQRRATEFGVGEHLGERQVRGGERLQRVVREDRRGRLRAELGGDHLGVLRRGERMAERVELERDEEPPLVVVAALQQRDVQVPAGLERPQRR